MGRKPMVSHLFCMEDCRMHVRADVSSVCAVNQKEIIHIQLLFSCQNQRSASCTGHRYARFACRTQIPASLARWVVSLMLLLQKPMQRCMIMGICDKIMSRNCKRVSLLLPLAFLRPASLLMSTGRIRVLLPRRTEASRGCHKKDTGNNMYHQRTLFNSHT